MLGLGAPAGGEPAARQQLQRDRTPPARDVAQLVAPDLRHQQVRRLLGVAILEQRRCARHVGPAREHDRVEVLVDVDALLRGGERERDVAGRERRERAVEEVPGDTLHVVHQPRGLHATLDHLGGLRHAPLRSTTPFPGSGP